MDIDFLSIRSRSVYNTFRAFRGKLGISNVFSGVAVNARNIRGRRSYQVFTTFQEKCTTTGIYA